MFLTDCPHKKKVYMICCPVNLRIIKHHCELRLFFPERTNHFSPRGLDFPSPALLFTFIVIWFHEKSDLTIVVDVAHVNRTVRVGNENDLKLK
jgi:hypothetical protein